MTLFSEITQSQAQQVQQVQQQGDYVVGRSLEKIAPVVASAIGGVRQ